MASRVQETLTSVLSDYFQVMYSVAKLSCLAWWIQVAWDRPNCRSSLGRKGMASIVLATMNPCLVVGLTYIYQIMQTQVLVAAFSATPISSHQDNRARSSQVPKPSLLQITRCLDSNSDKTPAEKDLAGKIVKTQSVIDRMANSEFAGRASLIIPPFLSTGTFSAS